MGFVTLLLLHYDLSAADYINVEFMTYSKPSSTEDMSNDNCIMNMKINTRNVIL